LSVNANLGKENSA